MELPEPASTLWKRHREAVEQLATGPGEKNRVLLGGGTILAARWQHRRSTDIDVLLPERESLNDGGKEGRST